jgi:CSLREA domain-containing protein
VGISKAGITLVAALALLASDASAATIEPSVKVDGTTSNGNCTLREAVEAANTNAAVDACHKGSASKLDRIPLKKGDYELTLPGEEDLNAGGDLDMVDGGPMEIRGRGIAKTTIEAPIGERAIDLFTDARLKLRNLTVDGGSAGLRGGALRADGGAGLALSLQATKVRGGSAQFGGGLGMVRGKLRVKRSIFVDNDAVVNSTGIPTVQTNGGAMNLLFDVDAVVVDSTFEDNDAHMNDSIASGGAISQSGVGGGSLTIRRSLFTGNDAFSTTGDPASTRRGGAVYSEATSEALHVVNSSFHLNRALGSGAGARGGAIFAEADSAEIVNSTFLANAGTSGSALFVNAGSLELSRSAFDRLGQGPLCGVGGGSFASEGYNVVGPDPFGCAVDGPKDKNADPLLSGAPGDNGGPTDTIKLGKASPAIDRIPKNKCGPAEGVDQRGYRRPAGKGCDSGAFERGAKPR